MGTRMMRTIGDVTQDPNRSYKAGYRWGYVPDWVKGGAAALAGGSVLLPLIADPLGIPSNVSMIGSALIDTGAESGVNWLSNIPAQRNAIYAGTNLAGNLGGTLLARNLTGTEEEPNPLIDGLGLFGGELIGDALTDAAYGDVEGGWKGIPRHIYDSAVGIPSNVMKGMGAMMDANNETDIKQALEDAGIDPQKFRNQASNVVLGVAGREEGIRDRKENRGFRDNRLRPTYDPFMVAAAAKYAEDKKAGRSSIVEEDLENYYVPVDTEYDSYRNSTSFSDDPKTRYLQQVPIIIERENPQASQAEKAELFKQLVEEEQRKEALSFYNTEEGRRMIDAYEKDLFLTSVITPEENPHNRIPLRNDTIAKGRRANIIGRFI